MKQIKLAFVLLTIMIVLGNCTFENRTTTTKMCLEDLDMNVQDTLRNLPVDSFGCHPDLIDLTGHYKLIIKEFGPWCYAQKLTYGQLIDLLSKRYSIRDVAKLSGKSVSTVQRVKQLLTVQSSQ